MLFTTECAFGSAGNFTSTHFLTFVRVLCSLASTQVFGRHIQYLYILCYGDENIVKGSNS